ncbi:hypothetical protein, partial [Pseudomonas defluvii]|uniref:hypothetical protein n=1 Tax=Pseudomonas defluvii TaxID=1876757 RepID=UPI0039068A69
PEFITGCNKPLGSFYLFTYKEQKHRDQSLGLLLKLLESIPSINGITFSLNAIESKKPMLESYMLDKYPFGIAWVVFTGNDKEIETELSKINHTDNNDEKYINSHLARWESSQIESKQRSKIIKLHLNECQNLGPFKGYATHTLNNLFHICDFDSAPVKKGPMFDDDLYTDGEAIDLACGITGLHPYIFITSTSPHRHVHFNTLRLDLDAFLKHNTSWQKCVGELFSSLCEYDEIDIQIFNPLNIFGLLNDLYVDGTSQRIPHIKARVTSQNGETREYYGGLFWNMQKSNTSPAEAISSSYPNLNTFRARSVINTITEYDEALSDTLGLSYGLLDLTDSKRYYPEEQAWTNIDLKQISNLEDFVMQNDDLIVSVGAFFSAHGIGIGNRTNTVEINNA